MTERKAQTSSPFSACQWIKDDPVHGTGQKCGRPTLTGSPYCPAHHEQAYVRKKSKPEEIVGGDS
jgi:hypothetical protein